MKLKPWKNQPKSGKKCAKNENAIPVCRAEMPECLVTMFSRKFCNFGFAAHLFQEDIRNLEGRRGPTYLLDSARVQQSSILDSARVQQHKTLDSARMQQSTISDSARWQQHKTLDSARLQQSTIPDSARVQQCNILECTMSRQTQTVNSAEGPSSSLHLTRGQPNISDSVRGSAHLSNSGLQKRANIRSQSSASFSNEFLLHLLTFSSSDPKESNRSHLQKQIRELDILEGINIRYKIVRSLQFIDILSRKKCLSYVYFATIFAFFQAFGKKVK
jgi:hypothetical protein